MQQELVKKLSLGTAQLGARYGVSNTQGKISPQEAERIFRFAEQVGITTLDTAIAYGESEEVLGRVNVAKWKVISKLPAAPLGSVDVINWGIDQIKNSLNRLRIPSLHGILLHHPVQLLDAGGEQIYRLLQLLKKEGLTQKIGISIYDAHHLEQLIENYEFDIIQLPINVLDNRLLKSGWLTQLANLGMELHARSVFLQGLLLMPPNSRPSKFLRWQDKWLIWDKWLKEKELSPLQACMGHVLSIKQIKNIIVGIESLEQLKEIIGSLDDIPPQLPEELDLNDENLLNPSKWEHLC